MEIKICIFLRDVPSTFAWCLLVPRECSLSPGQSSLCFERGQDSGNWCFPFALALKLTNWASRCVDLSVTACLSCMRASGVTVSATFFNIRALFIELLSLASKYLQQYLSSCLLAANITLYHLWSFLCCTPTAFCSKSSFSHCSERFLQSLSRLQTHLQLRALWLHPVPTQEHGGCHTGPRSADMPGSYLGTTSASPGDFMETIFVLMKSKMVFFIKPGSLECLPSTGGALQSGGLWQRLRGQWYLPEVLPSGPSLALVRLLGENFMHQNKSWYF